MPERPPRGYDLQQFGLRHRFEHQFSLSVEDETKNSTFIPIIRGSEACNVVETINVNPSNATFAEETGITCNIGSIIPRISLSMTAKLSKLAIKTDEIKALKFNWMPVYSGFLESLTPIDSLNTSISVEDILELTHTVGDKNVDPIFSTVKLPNGSAMPLSTVNDADEALADWGLTTTAVLESVAFDKELFFQAAQYFSIKGMLRKITGRMRTEVVKQDHFWSYHSSNYTHPNVKRVNPYTICGILVHLPQAGEADQIALAADTTALALGHIDFTAIVRYTEWHPSFEQEAI